MVLGKFQVHVGAQRRVHDIIECGTLPKFRFETWQHESTVESLVVRYGMTRIMLCHVCNFWPALACYRYGVQDRAFN